MDFGHVELGCNSEIDVLGDIIMGETIILYVNQFNVIDLTRWDQHSHKRCYFRMLILQIWRKMFRSI